MGKLAANGLVRFKIQLPANVELVSGSTTLNGEALTNKDVWNKGQLTVSPVTLQAGCNSEYYFPSESIRESARFNR